MFLNIPKFINNYRSKHRDVLNAIFGQGVSTFAGGLVYGLLPAYLMFFMGETGAGFYMGLFNFIAAFLINPIAGLLSDRIGSKKVLILATLLLFIAGLIWIFLPITLPLLVVFSLFYFAFYAFLVTEVYILRSIKKEEGGFIFGLADNLYAVFYLLSSMAIPYFTAIEKTSLAGVIILISAVVHLSLIAFIKKDKTERYSRKFGLNPFEAFTKARHFIRINKGFPVLVLGAGLFQGLFYGTIWFVFPIHLLQSGGATLIDSLLLGIYEIVTILLAGFSGYIADKFDWRKINTWGWLMIIVGTGLMPFYTETIALIAIGAFIAIGNNFEYYASQHALEEYDIDHKEDGSFIALSKTFLDIGFALSPIFAGFAYANYGFGASLVFNFLACTALAIWMIRVTWKKR